MQVQVYARAVVFYLTMLICCQGVARCYGGLYCEALYRDDRIVSIMIFNIDL